jgi:hypothetical protein
LIPTPNHGNPVILLIKVKTFSEVFHQQAVDEDISATDAAQEDQVNAVVEEGDESPREEVVMGEDEAEGVVLDNLP